LLLSPLDADLPIMLSATPRQFRLIADATPLRLLSPFMMPPCYADAAIAIRFQLI